MDDEEFLPFFILFSSHHWGTNWPLCHLSIRCCSRTLQALLHTFSLLHKFSLRSWLHFLLLTITAIPNTFSDVEVWALGWSSVGTIRGCGSGCVLDQRSPNLGLESGFQVLDFAGTGRYSCRWPISFISSSIHHQCLQNTDWKLDSRSRFEDLCL